MVYRFGRFVLDRDSRQLLRDGDEVHLTPKAFEVLEVLLANRARALSKTELQERIWPSTFVEETNIASLVAEIRRVLHDAAFVRTIYGFGYQFAGEVTEGTPAGHAPARLWLVFERRQIPLMEGVHVIGRAPDATIPIDSPGISRYHARIIVERGAATLEDLKSKNGTQLNGALIESPTPLTDGDEIGLGAVVLTLRTQPQVTPTESMPPRAQ